jgi:hypothetical protein
MIDTTATVIDGIGTSTATGIIAFPVITIYGISDNRISAPTVVWVTTPATIVGIVWVTPTTVIPGTVIATPAVVGVWITPTTIIPWIAPSEAPADAP